MKEILSRMCVREKDIRVRGCNAFVTRIRQKENIKQKHWLRGK